MKDKTFCDGKWVMEIDGAIDSGQINAYEFQVTMFERMRGLLYREPDEVTRILVPCHDIHTFGMKYEIDVAFIAKNGQVLEVHRKLGAGRRLRRKDASFVAERFAKDGEWLSAGDTIKLGALNAV